MHFALVSLVKRMAFDPLWHTIFQVCKFKVLNDLFWKLNFMAYFIHIQITEWNCSLLFYAFRTSEEKRKHKPIISWLYFIGIIYHLKNLREFDVLCRSEGWVILFYVMGLQYWWNPLLIERRHQWYVILICIIDASNEKFHKVIFFLISN